MKNLKGAALLGQSGGPTSVINASAAGVFIRSTWVKPNITAVYGAVHGIKGILNEDFMISKEDIEELNRLKNTPSSAIGRLRYKLKNPKVDDSDYQRF
jgi:ATP-dependent phosphofructokinase / diphosphate-dependent phosphofructokinase